MPGKQAHHGRARATVLCTQDGKMLLVKKKGGKWNFPGGAIEQGELPQQAAIRELREEAGLCAQGLLPLCSLEVEGILHYIFTTQLSPHDRASPHHEIVACKWVLRSELKRVALNASAAALVARQLPMLCA
ncbi:NUDIX domain-containing protein [Pseudomonas sp. NPDC089996]|uniref:NUDIX domain-containing protein n=1 Tax=Pseudomonas sp. NPDC089996 TaxID=3364474 RepID=UPI0038203A4A